MMLLSNAANLFRRSFANRPTFATLADPTLERIARRREGKTGNSGGALAKGPGSPFLFFSGLTIPAPPLRAGLGAWGSYSWSSVCQSEGTRPAGPGTG